MAYGVTPQDIRLAAFGIEIPEGSETDNQLAALIDKAELRLGAHVPTIAARVADGTLDVVLVRGVVEDMVIRVVKNPRSLRTLGTDDFQATIDNSISAGLLYVAAEELTLLAPGGAPRSVGSIQMGLPVWRWPRA